MLGPLFAVAMIGSNPPDPGIAAASALSKHDYRVAGLTGFWEASRIKQEVSTDSAQTHQSIWRPYGLVCKELPDTAYAYNYFVSDAIGRDAFDDYRKQKAFLIVYNSIMLRSGKLDPNWGCVKDPHPKWSG